MVSESDDTCVGDRWFCDMPGLHTVGVSDIKVKL